MDRDSRHDRILDGEDDSEDADSFGGVFVINGTALLEVAFLPL
jgi:hypothetical protein